MGWKTRLFIFAASLLLLGVAWNIAASCQDTAPGQLEKSRLDARISEVHFDRAPLQKVLEKLAAQSGVEINVNWKSLERIDIDRQTPLTMHMFDMPLRHVLEIIMREVTGSPDFALDHDTVKIAFQNDLYVPVVRAYDISGFLSLPLDRTDQANRIAYLEKRDERLAQLQAVIERAIDPENWDHGPGPSLTEFGGELIVIQSPQNQRRVAGLLIQLRHILSATGSGLPTPRGVDAVPPF